MNSLILLAAVAAEAGNEPNQIEQIAKTFGVDRPHLIAQIISFCIVAFLLHRFAYKKVLVILETRRQKIAEGLANAQKSKEELAKAEATREEILAKANTEANRLIEEGRAAAARIQEQETQKAITEAAQIIAKAQEAAVLERSRTMTELRRELGRLVVETTGRVVGKVLTPQDQQRLAEETNQQLTE